MKKILSSVALFALMATANAQTTHTVTSSGNTFAPDTVQCVVGDDVNFVLAGIHNAVEVSLATWNANGTTSNGGFSLPFGGGTVTMNSAGTFYYVCTNHASMGMKGVIIVSNANGINENKDDLNIRVFPTAVSDFLNVKMELSSAAQVQVLVYNLLGENAISLPLNYFSAGSTAMQLDLSALRSGIYFVKFISGTNMKTFRVIKA